MKRSDEVLLHFQKSAELTGSKKPYLDHITQLFKWMIQADSVNNDITSKTLAITGKGKAEIITRQGGIIAGLEEINELLRKHTSLHFNKKVSDGDRVSKDTIIAEVSGKNSEILAYERTILNILGRMSGVATETDTLVFSIKNISIAPQLSSLRKTPLMLLDKKAVAVGGALTHRLSLADEILIKDNHLEMLQKALHLQTAEQAAEVAITKCMQAASEYFEIEADTLSQANAILHAFVRENAKRKNKKMMTILLDNFTPANAKKFVASLKKLPVYDFVLIEASGEINKTNLAEWATTGVDVISLGVLTHSPKVFNFSMQY